MVIYANRNLQFDRKQTEKTAAAYSFVSSFSDIYAPFDFDMKNVGFAKAPRDAVKARAGYSIGLIFNACMGKDKTGLAL